MKRLQKMPGASFERPRAYKLTDIEPQAGKQGPGGCSRAAEDSGSPLGSGNNMGSVARFPKLDECAHFHYEHVELGSLEVSVSGAEEQSPESFAVRVTSGDACWTLQRTYENLVMFDKQLHRCIFDRKFSQLPGLSEEDERELQPERLRDYFRRFSGLSHEGLNCGPVLNWLQLDNRGRRILVPEADSCPINTPAVAAAYAVRPYQAQAQDEISFQVGDMISVIDMPPAGESTWWRGKHGFAVGFFPAECVAVIGDKLPRHIGFPLAAPGPAAAAQQPARLQPARLQPVKPVLRKHGKLIAFFRSFILNRPSRRRLKQSGILRERVFGCDLGEHLLNSGQEVPCVLSCCADFIERHGLVDGIYRLSGVSSNIQRLRHAFDEDRVPALHSDEGILQDIHSVASLLKMYFRELPNPLCTYQLYSTFVSAVQSASDAERLARMRDAVRKLPPPHYRTLEYLMRHLVRVAARGEETGMTPRNVAIVWAPNLLRCKELEVGGVAALQGVGVQAVVTEFLICYAELIFAAGPTEATGSPPPSAGQRPKSLAIAGSSARLLSLEEARNRSLVTEPELIEVGAGSAGLPPHYHTIIELPAGSQRKRNGSKRSPSLNWRALFGGKPAGPSRQPSRQPSASKSRSTAEVKRPEETSSLRRLRPVKSADSLDGAEDGLGPLLGPSSARPCGHSRSVSHDSYFEHLGDAASAASPLDLSEIQLSFDLEEREMRMLSEGESARQSLEASPRRQRAVELPASSLGPELGSSGGAALAGGSKRKRSRLEERLQCEVELRFIDSQSPDQVMVSADVHEMETPSPLPTPGYLPLLSEGSTPLTPSTTPAAVSPRISFKSFVLPLEIGEPVNSPTTAALDKGNLLHPCLTKASREQNSPCSLSLDCNVEDSSSKQANAMDACEEFPDTPGERSSPLSSQLLPFISPPSESVDQEMTPCDRLPDLDKASEMTETAYHGLEVSSCLPNVLHRDEERHNNVDKALGKSETTKAEQVSNEQNINASDLANMTDLDSLMPYEQSYQPSSDSNFNPIDLLDKVSDTEISQTDNYIKSDLESAEKWLISDLSEDSMALSKEINNQQLQRITESKVSQMLTTEDCLLSLNNPKNDENSIYYSISDKIYDSGRNEQSPNSKFNSLCGDNTSSSPRTDDSHQMETAKILNLVSTKTDLLPPKNDLETKCASNYENSVCEVNANIKSLSNYQNDQIENQISSWNSLLDDKSFCHTNQNVKDKSTDSKDQNNKFFSDGKSGVTQIADLIHNPQEKSSKDDTYDESKKSNKCIQSIQVSNCSNVRSTHNEYIIQESNNSNSIKDTRAQDDLDVVVPSECAAAEPQEMAHVPDVLSENIALNRSCTFSPSNNTNLEKDSTIHKDTAAILQELALQRLSGGDRVDTIPLRRRYDTDVIRDRRSFDSEIGREIVREHKMKQELENARGKLDECLVSNHGLNVPVSHLPPCLRARHARATRAALSRSLDEAKFNKMTSGSSVSSDGQRNANKGEVSQQHGSTPNVGSKLSSSQRISERSTQSLNKNLGLDLDDPRCRERIEKYKEERRTFLRDKYRSESFRAQTSPAVSSDATSNNEDGEQALLARLKQRASRPSLL